MLVASLPSTATRILAIEDDPILAADLDSHLVQRGFSVTVRQDGGHVLDLLREERFDLILMDIMLPGSSGLQVLAQLRQRQRIPVILMSALGAEQDRITGFSQGADDYLPKPFSMLEMDVRIDAILRRVAYEQERLAPITQHPQLVFDEQRADVCRNDVWANLTATEYRVLETLVQHSGETLSKAFLYQQIMHRAYSQHDRSLDMHVSRVRRKLQAIGYTAGRIETVRGMGYLLTPLPS
ncbi:response regulator transcription factor [Pseudomonas sp. P115]|uniref:response regulator transcription factor n=1 Tax=Pseudomonas pisciculturae TaxID=2730413 RepID=UPI001891FEAA|nr:response regulator transcription factor [Pseudomonas pisciculturae]MBF6029751.1 response regulator transcription factor [Pseudomonas pisciculturae]